MEYESQEEQRYGRNKNTSIDSSYISSGEYRKKFDKVTDNEEINKLLFSLSKKILVHRAGTILEDMYWINPNTCTVVARETKQVIPRKVIYSRKTKAIIAKTPGLITLHNHPSSYPPSIDDFNSNYNYDYSSGIICCHNGKIFIYSADSLSEERLYEAYVNDNRKVMAEYEAQLNALHRMAAISKIKFKEVN